MNLFTRAFSKIFKSPNQQELDKTRNIIFAINNKENEIKSLSEGDIKEKTFNFRKNVQNSSLKLSDIMPEGFALVREAAKRTLGERHYDVQLAGGIILHSGKIAEMKTGEGKTLVSTLPAYLNSLTGKGVHIVTVNDYLARRDSEWMGKVFNYLGISTGCITNDLDDIQRKTNYNHDITYATNNELGFDYLRDNMKYELDEMVQRSHNYCIVDEVDSILIDESRTPLVISGKIEDKTTLYSTSNDFIKHLQKEDYELDEKDKNAILTDVGIDKIEKLASQKKLLKNNNFYDPANLDLVHHINQALKANLLFKKDTDYIVRDEKVQIIDEFTGRVLSGRRFSDGLHQSIEAKENVKIEEENQTLASITYQNYFRLYQKLAGMTGTAITEAEEFYDIYKLNVVSIPTNKKMLRKDLNDKIFRTEKEKYNAITKKIIECNDIGQPTLVGTTSIEKSEKISSLLSKKKIKHKVLNAKQHDKEAQIIAEAGKTGAVTIATNMAGRGTDIKLGGNKDFIKDGKKVDSNEIKENEIEVKKLGGLFIIGTERHESRRIDNQLRGRAGRQGDPGNTIFFISLQDELMRIFGGESIDGMLKKLGLKENESIDHPWINKAMERAQKKVEGRNFDIRKTLIKFDDVMNDQRQVIFSQRLKILKEKKIDEILKDFFDEILKDLNKTKQDYLKSNDKKKYLTEIKSITGNAISDAELINDAKIEEKDFHKKLSELYSVKRKSRIQLIGENQNNSLEKKIFLQIIDHSWRSHLQYLEQLRQVIGLRQYGQKDPLSEFKKEAFVLFEGLLDKIKKDLIKFLLNLNIVVSNDDQNDGAVKKEVVKKEEKKIGRNEKCPCGSGKKFKHCHGNI
ncbi:preprotein translocase subunit SecA [Pelagibacteraceae bacterium]|jgi:preprotein translocase subunit SecA|nr:preprotein translocase subunit SecA [Pelagibacteraceae bacterium]MDC0952858.1 preprotein translocase subunit SecA [Pelagibacteraceae bacterium]